MKFLYTFVLQFFVDEIFQFNFFVLTTNYVTACIMMHHKTDCNVVFLLKRLCEKIDDMIMFVLNPYIYHVNISRIVFTQDIDNWCLTTAHYANFDVISGQNKNIKLKYLINKALER